MNKLHLGCGAHTMGDGWTNIDMLPSVPTGHHYICHDLSNGLPKQIEDNSIDFIFNEHFLEHLSYPQAEILLKDCYNKLKPGGTIRIVIPDLEYIIKKYNENDCDWGGIGGWQPRNRCVMINQAFNAWGHQFQYDIGELYHILQSVGFKKFYRPDNMESVHPELNNLGYRVSIYDLKVEATK